MAFNQGFQLYLSVSRCYPLHLDNLSIHLLFEAIIWIVKVSNTTCHTSAHISTNSAKNHNDTTSHVLTDVITAAFYYSLYTTISHAEALSSSAVGIKLSTGRSVQTSITNNARFTWNKASTFIRNHNNFSSMHSFSDIVISFAN